MRSFACMKQESKQFENLKSTVGLHRTSSIEFLVIGFVGLGQSVVPHLECDCLM